MFDEIYWNFIDTKFHGPFTTIEDQPTLLSTEEQVEIDAFVETKMQEASEGNLVTYLQH